DLDRPVAAQCAGPPHKASAFAGPNWQFDVDPTVEADHVALTNIHQLAQGDSRRAELDGDRQLRAADTGRYLDAVIFGGIRARAGGEPGLRVQAVHQRLNY